MSDVLEGGAAGLWQGLDFPEAPVIAVGGVVSPVYTPVTEDGSEGVVEVELGGQPQVVVGVAVDLVTSVLSNMK